MVKVHTDPGQKGDSISKTTRAKELEEWLKQKSTCATHAKPYIQTPVLLKKSSTMKREKSY
jgi:hypothetical protein